MMIINKEMERKPAETRAEGKLALLTLVIVGLFFLLIALLF